MKIPDVNRESLLLAEPAIHYVLAFLGAVLLGWPLIQIADDSNAIALVIYISLASAALGILLFAVSHSLRRVWQPAEDNQDSFPQWR